MQQPIPLQKGDQIALSAPARKITAEELAPAIKRIEQAGFEVVYDNRLFAVDNQFAGSDRLRTELLQHYLDDPAIKAVFFVRGGYGSLRIVDQLDFSNFSKSPKWLVGYSDITVIHAKLQQLGFESLHASMPINFENNTETALQSLFNALENKFQTVTLTPHPLNKMGEAEAPIVGGNLSTLYSLLGSALFPDTKGKILFLEDLDEYLYHIDRMMLALKRAGKLTHLAGLIIGGMTAMNDNSIPFGKTAEEIIAEHVSAFDYPVCFGFPAGHLKDNRALALGRKSRLAIAADRLVFEQ
ncbi:MAG: LD-carboxypeptidase [Bacteroidetes bacterium]|nr:LD-carboxypeptidase [Bacteroidota bacterium]MBU1578447.1 LD-carboxypeptidase [Bacteroidota bacterium]MBU2466563.1 LD-carboxypeptidase [Bacteroidota bacterium]MBU2557503.1 LD-carboxypeptidase [Bacteroidota bacterium]